MLIGHMKLKKKVAAFSVVDSASGLVLGIETSISKANDLRDKHRGSRVQMDQYDEDQLGQLLREQARRESIPAPAVSETRISISSLTPADGYDPLTMLTQAEIDMVVKSLRNLRHGSLKPFSDADLEEEK